MFRCVAGFAPVGSPLWRSFGRIPNRDVSSGEAPKPFAQYPRTLPYGCRSVVGCKRMASPPLQRNEARTIDMRRVTLVVVGTCVAMELFLLLGDYVFNYFDVFGERAIRR